jgi:CBS domain-containing membrane protein
LIGLSACVRAHRLQALPVIDCARRVIGMLTKTDFLRHVEQQDYSLLGRALRALLVRTPQTHSGKAEVVGQIMTPCVQTVSASAPIVQLVSLMADQGVHQIPVLDDERKLVGMVTQSDMVAALYVINLRQLSGMP